MSARDVVPSWRMEMSLRDWVAGQVAASMAGGLIAAKIDHGPEDAKTIAKAAFILADEFIKEREK